MSGLNAIDAVETCFSKPLEIDALVYINIMC